MYDADPKEVTHNEHFNFARRLFLCQRNVRAPDNPAALRALRSRDDSASPIMGIREAKMASPLTCFILFILRLCTVELVPSFGTRQARGRCIVLVNPQH